MKKEPIMSSSSIVDAEYKRNYDAQIIMIHFDGLVIFSLYPISLVDTANSPQHAISFIFYSLYII